MSVLEINDLHVTVEADGGVKEIFEHLILWFDTCIEDVDKGKDDWGYAYRPVRGQSSGFSNHASGTAIDLNALQHPRGKINTFNEAQRNAIRKQLRDVYKGVIRWGGDYDLRIAKRDDMHFEINASSDKVKAVVKTLNCTETEQPVPVKPEPVRNPKPVEGEKVWQNTNNSKADNIGIAKTLNALGFNAGYPDGIAGPYLRDGVRAYQSAQVYYPGMVPDGDWGPKTQAHYEWVKYLQSHLDDWVASQRLGWIAEDGNYGSVTGKHVLAIQRGNIALYKKTGATVFDQIAGPRMCKMLGIKAHPSA